MLPRSAVPDPAPLDAAANLRAALTLLGGLQAGGLTALVLCPGSRSSPLALAAGLLETRGLPLYTGIDERSAAFFGLGLARASGTPVGVITTSGTAVANLLPAAVEADMGAVGLLLLSADRPARLKGCGANQTVNQESFLRAAVRWLGQGDPAGLGHMNAQGLLALAEQAIGACLGNAAGGAPAGPVHLNLPFDEPLHSSAAGWQEAQAWLSTQLSTQAWGKTLGPAAAPGAAAPSPPPLALDPDRPGVVVAGPWRGTPQQWPGHVEALRQWQQRTGWPVLADGLSGLRGLADLVLVGAYDLVLNDPAPWLAVDQVLRLGPLPASRRLQTWLAEGRGEQRLISEGEPRRLDPLGTVQQQWSQGLEAWCAALPQATWGGQPAVQALALQARWRQADDAVQQLLRHQLQTPAGPPDAPISEPQLARTLSGLLPEGLPLVIANSSPVRDWESFADPGAAARAVLSFRGASGIDGTLSLACGVAEALGRAVLLSGDLALLHDSNGWLWRQQLRGQLTVVLINNGGGGIFEQLPIRDPAAPHGPAAMPFERLFAMPQAVDQALLCQAHGVPSRSVSRAHEFPNALSWALQQPLALLEVHTDRRADAALRQRLRTMALAAIGAP